MTPAAHTYPPILLAFLAVCVVLTFAAFARMAFDRVMRVDLRGPLDGRDER